MLERESKNEVNKVVKKGDEDKIVEGEGVKVDMDGFEEKDIRRVYM